MQKNMDKNMKIYEQWWENNLPYRLEDMKRWFGNGNLKFRKYPRRLIKKMNYESILDAGAGLCVEYYGFQKDYPEITYTGLDITPGFVRIGKEKGINILQGSVEKIPFSDNSFDCVYLRDTMRHLESYEKALKECIRVCKKEAMVIFCRKLTNKKENIINYKSDRKLYNNMYSKKKIKEFLSQDKNIKFFYFEHIDGKNGQDTLLRIFKRIDLLEKYKIYMYIRRYGVYINWNAQLFCKLLARSIKKIIKNEKI